MAMRVQSAMVCRRWAAGQKKGLIRVGSLSSLHASTDHAPGRGQLKEVDPDGGLRMGTGGRTNDEQHAVRETGPDSLLNERVRRGVNAGRRFVLRSEATGQPSTFFIEIEGGHSHLRGKE